MNATQGLSHFLAAQEPVYGQVVRELEAGRKSSHWMWFIFPQLAGLGRSSTALRFGLQDRIHARNYLRHPVLGGRLRECTHLMLANAGRSAHQILGSPDDLKFRSCMTLFAACAENEEDRTLFEHALRSFNDGQPDPVTMSMLDANGD